MPAPKRYYPCAYSAPQRRAEQAAPGTEKVGRSDTLPAGDCRRPSAVPRRVARGGGRAVRRAPRSPKPARSTRSPALLERGGDVDLVLLDLAMPGVRGFSGLMYLRAQYPSVPVVVVSANDDPAVIRRCMDFGASGFIPKTLGVDGDAQRDRARARRRRVDAARRRSRRRRGCRDRRV